MTYKKILNIVELVLVAALLVACSKNEKSDQLSQDLEQILPVPNTNLPPPAGDFISAPSPIPELELPEDSSDNLNSDNLNNETSDNLNNNEVNDPNTGVDLSGGSSEVPNVEVGPSVSDETKVVNDSNNSDNSDDSDNNEVSDPKQVVEYFYDNKTGACRNLNGRTGYNLNYLGDCGLIKNQIISNKIISNISAKGIKFYNVILFQVQFDNVDFTKAEFKRSLLKKIHFNNSQLSKAKFKNSIFLNVEFYKTEIAKSIFNRNLLF